MKSFFHWDILCLRFLSMSFSWAFLGSSTNLDGKLMHLHRDHTPRSFLSIAGMSLHNRISLNWGTNVSTVSLYIPRNGIGSFPVNSFINPELILLSPCGSLATMTRFPCKFANSG